MDLTTLFGRTLLYIWSIRLNGDTECSICFSSSAALWSSMFSTFPEAPFLRKHIQNANFTYVWVGRYSCYYLFYVNYSSNQSRKNFPGNCRHLLGKQKWTDVSLDYGVRSLKKRVSKHKIVHFLKTGFKIDESKLFEHCVK